MMCTACSRCKSSPQVSPVPPCECVGLDVLAFLSAPLSASSVNACCERLKLVLRQQDKAAVLWNAVLWKSSHLLRNGGG